MNRYRFAKYMTSLAIAGLIYLAAAYAVNANPPEPQSSFKWHPNMDQTVTLYFLEKDGVVVYVYPLAHEAEPARDCVRSYDKTTFTFISISEMVPHRYTMRREPIAVKRWDSKVFTPLVESTHLKTSP